MPVREHRGKLDGVDRCNAHLKKGGVKQDDSLLTSVDFADRNLLRSNWMLV